jgi:CBS domain-containing protein
LDELLKTDSDEYEKFLYSPCVKAAKELARIKADDNIESFLHLFQKSGFGFSWVESKTASGFASVLDSLELYANGLIESDMTVGETASPIFSLPGETKIDAALQEMFDRKFRRVFVEGKNRLLTDRRIIGKVFSTERLPLASKNPKLFLDLKLADIEAAEPLYVKENARIKQAAISIRKVSEETLVCEKGVVTPWDLVIKPLEIGKLRINSWTHAQG